MSKKTRGPNFSSSEKEILITLITKFKDVVENKKTDAVTTAIKNEGWQKLTNEFNSLSSFSVRNTEQLKTCWDNIKRNTRKDKAKTKKEIFSTGGGRPNLPPPGPFQDQVEDLLGPTLDGLVNPFDSDAQFSNIDLIDVSDKPVIIDSEIEVIENSSIKLLERSKPRDDDCTKLVTENPPAVLLWTSKSKDDECPMEVPEDKNKKVWNGWSPAALKTKVSDTLEVKKKDSPSWLQRRRPKTSLHDNILKSKLELIELMKTNSETESKIKQQVLEEQLKQEKIKTEMMELDLMLKKKECKK